MADELPRRPDGHYCACPCLCFCEGVPRHRDLGCQTLCPAANAVADTTTKVDLDTSDATTGLAPLDEVDPTITLLVLDWRAQVGVAAVPGEIKPIPVRYLSVRGLTRMEGDDPTKVEWAQFHIAVPTEHAMDVAAALASGGMFQVGGDLADD